MGGKPRKKAQLKADLLELQYEPAPSPCRPDRIVLRAGSFEGLSSLEGFSWYWQIFAGSRIIGYGSADDHVLAFRAASERLMSIEGTQLPSEFFADRATDAFNQRKPSSPVQLADAQLILDEANRIQKSTRAFADAMGLARRAAARAAKSRNQQ